MFVDAHIHPFKAIPQAWMDAVDEEGKKWFNGVDLSPQGFVNALDEAGMDKGIVLALQNRTVHISNEEIAEFCDKTNGRFIGFACVDPTKGEEAAKELEYAVKTLKLRGLGELTPPTQYFYPDDERVFPVYECAEKLGIPMVIHTGGEEVGLIKYSNPIHLDEVAQRYKDLTIIAEHMGSYPFGMWFDEVMNVAWKNPNVYVGVAALQERELIELNLLKKAIQYIGSDRIIFGSDYPTLPPRGIKYHADLILNSDISDSDKEKIMGGNIMSLMS